MQPVLVVVNDDPTVLRLLVRLLEEDGFAVNGFTSAVEALQRMDARHPPDGVVTDLHMPGIGGWQLCRLLRSPQYTAFNHVPVLVVSGTLAGGETAFLTEESGADAFLSFPFEQGALSRAVRGMLARRTVRQPVRVLLSDANPDVLMQMGEAFERHGFEVVKAVSTDELLKGFGTSGVDIAILDHDLANVRERGLLSEFCELRPDSAYLVTATNPAPEQVLIWLAAGASDCISKPLDPARLVVLCQNARREKDLLGAARTLEKRTAELREREAFFQAATRSAPVFTLTIDAQGTLTLLEGRGLKELGLSSEVLLGASVFEIFQGNPEILLSLQEALNGECVSIMSVIRGRTQELSCVPIPGEDGGVHGAVAVAIDVSERIQTRDALRKQEEQLSAVTSTLPAVIFQLTASLRGTREIRLITGRVADVLGGELDEGRSFEDFLERVDGQDRAAFLDSVDRAVTRLHPWSFSGRLCKPSGEQVWIRCSSTLQRDGDRLVFNGVIVDITENRRAEDLLRYRKEQLEKQGDALLALMEGGHLFAGRLGDALCEITEVSSSLIDVERVSVWFYEADYSVIRCQDLYERSSRRHSSGEELRAAEFPLYTASHKRGQVVVAVNVQEDPRTREIPRAYLEEHGIVSLLDAPIWLGDRIGGVLSFEQVGLPRSWSPEEERSAVMMATLLSLCYEIAERRQAQEALQQSQRELADVTANSPCMIFRFGQHADGTRGLHYVNERSLDIVGLDHCLEDFYDRFVSGVAEADRARFLESMDKAIAAAAPWDFDGRFVKPTGEIIWLHGACIPQRQATGELVFNGFFMDITKQKEAEDSLRNSEMRYRAFMSAQPDIYFRFDARGRFLDCQTRESQELFLPPTTFIGKLAEEVMPPDFAAFLLQKVLETLSGRSLVTFDYALEIHGQPMLYEARMVASGDEEVLAIVRDVTDRKKAENAQRFAAERTQVLLKLNQMIDSPLQAITDFALEEAIRLTESRIGYLAFVSDDESVLTMHSWSREAMSECAVTDKPQRYLLSETGLWGEAVRQRRPIVTNDYARPNPLKRGHPDGHVPLTRHMNVPVFSGSRIVAVAGVGNKASCYDDDNVQQLTLLMDGMWHMVERQRTYEALRVSEERFRGLFDMAPYPCVVNDSLGRYLLVNQAFCASRHLTPEEAIGKTNYDLGILETDEPQRAMRQQLAERSLLESAEVEVRRPDGSPGHILYSTRQIEMEGKLAYLSAIVDISELRRAEEEREKMQAQLLHAQRMESVGRLAGGVAHDFNNMLGVIIGYTELALMRAGLDPRTHADLEEILNAARRSADLTRQLLAFARKQAVSPKVLNLNDVVPGVLKMLQRLIGEDIRLAWTPGPDLGCTRIDPAQIDQILANLAVNARDAIAGVGAISIETGNVVFDEVYCQAHADSVPGEYVMLAVSDTGIGMDAQTQERIFDPFFTTKGEGKGTGLGLATVYGIVKQNEGAIHVYSELGHGTTFRVYFPRVNDPAMPLVLHDEVPQGGTEKILLVEDEETILRLGTSILEGLGYTVFAAKNPSQAIEIARTCTEAIHLLATDVVMPEMNGKELRDRIMAMRPEIKCLFASGYTADIIAHHGVLEKGIHFLQKPFSVRMLAQKIREALDQP